MRRQLGRKNFQPRKTTRRFRPLRLEQFEDRRLLTAAEDDTFFVAPTIPLVASVTGNDNYNSSWTQLGWNEETQQEEYLDEYASVSVMWNPAQGALDMSIDGGFEYIPNSTFSGSDSFEYQVCDNIGCDSAIVTFVANTVPIAFDDEYTTTRDWPLTRSAPGVLANDQDADGHQIVASFSSVRCRGN